MNKKLLAVALATAFAAPAMAEGVQIYGAFDVGVVTRGSGNVNDGTNGGVTSSKSTQTQVASGMNGHNGIGFKMSEDLGNGLTVGGDALFGFALDSGGNLGGSSLRTVYSYLSLSGDFGTFIGGRAGGARAGWIKKYDPFGGFGVANALSVHDSAAGNADYADNVLAWITPEIVPGLKGLFAYTTNLVGQDKIPTQSGSTPLFAVAAMYDNGPVSLVLNYERLKTFGVFGNEGRGEDTKVMTVGGSYDFGAAKVYALWDQLTNQTNGWQVGVSAPVSGAMTLKAGYARSTAHGAGSTNGAECSKMGAGVVYALSKRTSLYADAAHIDSDRGSNCAGRGGINTAGGSFSNGLGNTSPTVDGRDNATGFGSWGADMGVRHTF